MSTMYHVYKIMAKKDEVPASVELMATFQNTTWAQQFVKTREEDYSVGLFLVVTKGEIESAQTGVRGRGL